MIVIGDYPTSFLNLLRYSAVTYKGGVFVELDKFSSANFIFSILGEANIAAEIVVFL